MPTRYEQLLACSRDLFVTVDRSGGITYCSRSAQHVLGVPPAALLGQVLWEFVHPDEVARVHAALDGVLSSGRPAAIEFQMQGGDGGWRTLSAALQQAGSGEVALAAADVTELRTLEAALAQRESALRQAEKLELVGRLAGGIAHDFGNLLTIITGASTRLLDGLAADSPLRAHADTVRTGADRAAALVRQLLTFSRPQAEAPASLDLNQLVADAEQLLRRLLGEHIVLKTVLAAPLPPVKAGRSQVEQVLLNLAVNARDAMPSGGVLTIETKVISAEDSSSLLRKATPDVALSVTDTGTGMDARTRAQMFKPFFTTKAGHGTGLGLATVHDIVTQHGGWVDIVSDVGRGTSVTFGLPRAAEPVAAAPPLPGPASGGSERVLIVEDQDGVRELVKDMLALAGYQVIDAATPAEAEATSRSMGSSVDLLLTDVVMPGMSGLELADRLRRVSPRLRVLFMSGFPAPAVGEGVVGELGSHFLSKPFDRQGLLRAVRQALDGTRAE